MELALLLETLARTLNLSKIPVGSGAAQGGMQTPTIKTGAVREIEHNPLVLVSHPRMMMLWTFR